jgi:hypothetical protein
LYGNIGQQGITGAAGINNIATSNAGLGLNAMQIGGNNMNNAARTQAMIANPNTFTSPAAGYGNFLNSLFGNNAGSSGSGGLLGSAGGALSKLFGSIGGAGFGAPVNTGNPFSGTDLAQGGYADYAANNGPTASDISALTQGAGNIDTSNFFTDTSGSGGFSQFTDPNYNPWGQP